MAGDRRTSQNVRLEKISAKQQKAIECLAAGQTRATAAKKAGVHPDTVSRWLRDPDVYEALQTMRRSVWERSVSKAVNATSGGVDTLVEIHKSKKTPPYVRVQAVATLLQFAESAFARTDVERRIKQIQQLVEDADPN
ncbi:MAG: helix-turn-helix domain-containing protein [Cyanobacteria bacterium SBC]|nr:helix-turn-helix domain-containing protein [Cyanobacteria bacterium SBC]